MSVAWAPRDYQKQGLRHLCATPCAGLFEKPGLGKSSTVLAAFDVLREEGACQSALVVAPLRPCSKVWPEEIKKWADFNHLSYVVLHGPKKAELLKRKVDLYIINYEGLKWLAEQGLPPQIDMLIIDESTKVKNHRAKRSEIVQEIANRMKRVVILTGTPRPNSLIDLFSQVRVLDGGKRLGRYITYFRRQYFYELPQRGGFSLWVPREGAYEEIMEKISDLCLTLDYAGNLEMPPLVINTINVDLPESAREKYEELANDFMLSSAKGDVTAKNAGVLGMKLRQIVGGGVYVDEMRSDRDVVEFETNKLEALRDLVEEQSGEPLLVAVGFKHEVERIREYLGDEFGPLPYLGGSVSTTKSNVIIDDWNAGKIPVLLAHPTSVAHGLNLQAGGNSVVWYNLTWSAEEWEQMNCRVWRSGQAKAVTIHHIIAENTIDERVMEVLTKKIEDQKIMFDRFSNRKTQ